MLVPRGCLLVSLLMLASSPPAQAARFKVGTFVTPAAGGTQTIVHGLGRPPKALILWTTGAQTLGTINPSHQLAVGLSDGTTSLSVATNSDDNGGGVSAT